MTWQLSFEAEPSGKESVWSAWSRGIATAAQEALLLRGLTQPDRPIRIEAEFRFRRPKSTKATAAHVTRPSYEQLTMITNEGLSGIIYPHKREGLVSRWAVGKDYVDGPGSVLVTITEVV